MRESGILMPVASVPGPFGIGTLGKGAYDFVDFWPVRASMYGRYCRCLLRDSATARIKAARPLQETPTSLILNLYAEGGF